MEKGDIVLSLCNFKENSDHHHFLDRGKLIPNQNMKEIKYLLSQKQK